MRKNLAIAAILLGAALSATASDFSQESGFVRSFAVTGIDIVQNQPLAFGGLIPGAGGGTVTVSPAGMRTMAGVTPMGAAGFGPSEFLVTIEGNGNPHYLVTIPASVTLSGPGGATMLVDGFQQAATAGRVNPKTKEEILAVGATLHISSGQQSGTYSGSFPVTAHLGN